MLLKQIRSQDGTGTLSYLLVDESAKIAAAIDPNLEDYDTFCNMSDKLGVKITHVIDTHTHADHVTAAGKLKERFDATVIMHEETKNKWKVIDQGDKFGFGDTLRANAKVEIDLYVNDGVEVKVGSMKMKMLWTPGHTDNHLSVLLDDMIFTGDLLLIGQAGRSDLPGGNPEQQYDSLFKKILPLPDATKIYPGHDYENHTFAYLGAEKKTNPFLQQRSKAEYIQFVKDFFPPIAESMADGKMTLQCGVKRVTSSDEPFKNISPQALSKMIDQKETLFLLDVREPFELVKVGAVPGVVNIPSGQLIQRMNELPAPKSAAIVSICQSGGRSYEIAHYLSTHGYTNVYNLEGGTAAWKKQGYPVQIPVTR